jgi:hypothetical protein
MAFLMNIGKIEGMVIDVYIQFFAKHLLKMDSLKLYRQLTPILT